MYCSYCGNQIEKGAQFCTSCGSRVVAADSGVTAAQSSSSMLGDGGQASAEQYVSERVGIKESLSADKSSFWWGFLSLIFPIIGLVLYLQWKSSFPIRAKSCVIGAIIGFVINMFTYRSLF